MKCYNLFLLLAVLFLSNYAFAQIPPCPCDTLALSNGLIGNEIIDTICPGGVLGEDTAVIVEKDLFSVGLENAPFTVYFTNENNVDQKFCFINTDGPLGETLQLTDVEYRLCRQRLSEGCGVDDLFNIPPLSQWGLIAMAGVLGIVGFMVIRRRKATA